MSTKTAEVRTRIEPDLKKKANKIFKRLGLNESEGVRLLLKGLVLHRGIPFDFKVPNEETIKAMKDAEEGNTIGQFTSVDELTEELNS